MMDKAQQMMTEARQWVKDGRLDEATERYAWLWDNVLSISQGMGGVRGSYMVSEMTELAKRHPPAKVRFTLLRDQAAEKMAGDGAESDGLMDWISMNDAVSEPEKTLAWFDRAKESLDFRSHYPHIGMIFGMWLRKHGRWADSALFIDDARDKVEEDYHRWKMTESMMKRHPAMASRPELADTHAKMFRQGVASMYTALVAAGRGSEADDAMTLARGYAPGPQLIEEVAKTLASGPVVREADLKLVDELPESPDRESLRDKLRSKVG